MEIYLKIARLYLEETNHMSAEAYINRAALLQSEVTNKELHVVYKVGACVDVLNRGSFCPFNPETCRAEPL